MFYVYILLAYLRHIRLSLCLNFFNIKHKISLNYYVKNYLA